MKSKTIFLRLPLLLIGGFLVFSGSCSKDDKNENNTFKDPRDGNVYNIITIGNQVWMAENLRYLPSVKGPDTGRYHTTPFYFVYEYNGTSVTDAKLTANYETYGVLYNWSAAMSGLASSNATPSGIQGICPAGWHLPSNSEWIQLINYLGGESVAGAKLRETGTNHWPSPNTDATNESGFTALPGGSLSNFGTFYSIGICGYWWSATEFIFGDAYNLYLCNNVGINFFSPKEMGLSVRCVRD